MSVKFSIYLNVQGSDKKRDHFFFFDLWGVYQGTSLVLGKIPEVGRFP